MGDKVIHLGFAEPMAEFDEEIDDGIKFLSKIGGKPVLTHSDFLFCIPYYIYFNIYQNSLSFRSIDRFLWFDAIRVEMCESSVPHFVLASIAFFDFVSFFYSYFIW